MKALILNAQGKKDEAIQLINLALMFNLKSFTSWHIYGLMNRSDKKYDEARRCFTKSVEYDPSNTNVLRDLLLLELQLKDFQSAYTTSLKLLSKQNTNRVYNLCYLLSAHEIGEHDICIDYLRKNRDFLLQNQGKIHTSELYLFELKVLIAAGRYEDGLKLIEEESDKIVDKTIAKEMKATMLEKSGDIDGAKAILDELVEMNNSNFTYYLHIFRLNGVEVDPEKGAEGVDSQKFFDILKVYMDKYPKNQYLKRLGLTYLSGELFETQLKDYLLAVLKKGVPSFINDVKKMLRQDSAKFTTVETLLEDYLTQMKTTHGINGEEQDPTVQVFIWLFLGQLKDIKGDYDRAMELFEEAIDHTPTFIELHQAKARVLKHYGDNTAAEQVYKLAQSMDTADRFLNAKYAKYLLRDNQHEASEKVMLRWSEDQVTKEYNGHDLQNSWYETECAGTFMRQKEYLSAFRMYFYVECHINTMIDDQYDFHFYTLRKFLINKYLEMLAGEKTLFKNPYFIKATLGMYSVFKKLIKNKDETKKMIKEETTRAEELIKKNNKKNDDDEDG